jgi:hypothetical protein
MFGQPKNNLAAKVPYVLRYHIEGATVGHDAEEDLPIYGSRIVWDGVVEGTIQDIVTKQEDRKPERKPRRIGGLAREVPHRQGRGTSAEAQKTAARAGHNDRTIQRVLGRVGVTVGDPVHPGPQHFDDRFRTQLPVRSTSPLRLILYVSDAASYVIEYFVGYRPVFWYSCGSFRSFVTLGLLSK